MQILQIPTLRDALPGAEKLLEMRARQVTAVQIVRERISIQPQMLHYAVRALWAWLPPEWQMPL